MKMSAMGMNKTKVLVTDFLYWQAHSFNVSWPASMINMDSLLRAVKCMTPHGLLWSVNYLVSTPFLLYRTKDTYPSSDTPPKVTKTTDDGKKQWLFPECFHYLLRNQAHDGSWGIDVTSQTVGILDTATALLALLRHAAQPLQVQDYSSDEMAARIRMASQSLGAQLASWSDVAATNHIGVELILPALLDYLRHEDSSLSFDFNSKKTLEFMTAEKLSRFRPEVLYEKRPSSAVHSLEAFIGKIDFDKVSHHLFDGSMMASPSSTAAYLMNASTWDEEAEGYLRHVVKAGAGHSDGGIAGTFPIHYFEFNWVVATLLQAGFDLSDCNKTAVDGIVSIVKRGFAQDRGVLGFGKI